MGPRRGARSPEARVRGAAAAVVPGSDDRLGARHPARPAQPSAGLDADDRGGRADATARTRIARSREADLGAGVSRALGADACRSRALPRARMRVTMLVRCLAMMRGGGETRHLAWARELTALGVDVDVIAGQPLMLGGARHPLEDTEIAATIIRSPYMRDAVYRWGNTRGFGRLTMTALHADEEWFCRAA